MSDLGRKVKVTLDMFIATDSLSLTHQVRIMTLASTVFKKPTSTRPC